MPRDWKNDPEAIRRYCTCPADVIEAAIANGADAVVTLVGRWEQCPIHSDDPKFDLPPEFP